MRLNNISFPHPVLGIGGSVYGAISVDQEIIQNDAAYECRFSCHFEDEYIKNLIDFGKAKYFCEATCSATLYRESQLFDASEFTFTIDRKEVRGTVEVTVSIVAVEDIPEYVNGNVSPLYKGFDSFYVERGDLLAVFGVFPIEADIQYEKLKAVSQIFVVTGDNENETVSIDLDGPKINVKMAPGLFSLFCEERINKSTLYAPLFHASLVLNALVKAIGEIEKHKKEAWAKTIMHRLNTEQDIHPVFKAWKDPEKWVEIAQELLNNPYESMLSAIKKIDDKFNKE